MQKNYFNIKPVIIAWHSILIPALHEVYYSKHSGGCKRRYTYCLEGGNPKKVSMWQLNR